MYVGSKSRGFVQVWLEIPGANLIAGNGSLRVQMMLKCLREGFSKPGLGWWDEATRG